MKLPYDGPNTHVHVLRHVDFPYPHVIAMLDFPTYMSQYDRNAVVEKAFPPTHMVYAYGMFDPQFFAELRQHYAEGWEEVNENLVG